MPTIFREKQHSYNKVVTDRYGDSIKEGDTVMIHFPERPNSPGILYTVLAFNKAMPMEKNGVYPPVDLSFIKKERILLW